MVLLDWVYKCSQYYTYSLLFPFLQQEYKNEGIAASDIIYVDNRPVLDMFLMKPVGILALLDEESNFPKATDSTFVGKFIYTCTDICRRYFDADIGISNDINCVLIVKCYSHIRYMCLLRLTMIMN